MIFLSNTWKQITPLITNNFEVEKILGIPERKFFDVEYSHSIHLELWSYDELAVSVYLKDGKVHFISIVPNSKNNIPSDGEDWLYALGLSEEPNFLKSNMSKNGCVKIFAQKGLALHIDCPDATKNKFGIVDLIEIFPSMSLENYLINFYKETVHLEH